MQSSLNLRWEKPLSNRAWHFLPVSGKLPSLFRCIGELGFDIILFVIRFDSFSQSDEGIGIAQIPGIDVSDSNMHSMIPKFERERLIFELIPQLLVSHVSIL